MSLAEFSEFSRAFYGIALGFFLPASVVLIWRLAPRIGAGVARLIAVGNRIAGSLDEHSAALRRASVGDDTGRKVDEIHAVIVTRRP